MWVKMSPVKWPLTPSTDRKSHRLGMSLSLVRLPLTVECKGVDNCAICALSVEFHVQRLGYIRSQSYSLYRYVFDAGSNTHDISIGLSLLWKSQQIEHYPRGALRTLWTFES